MKECVIVDGVRTANARAHAEKGWFRNVRPETLLVSCYKALFERNPKVNPEDVEAVLCGCANPSGMQNDIGRLAWLAGDLPESVGSNTITQQCPSGMSAFEHAARAIMCGEGDIFVVSGVEDMQKVPMAANMDFPPALFQKYNPAEIPMGATAEKVAKVYKIQRVDQETMAFWSNKKAMEATNAGKFLKEIVPVQGLKDDGSPFMVDKDQWIRGDISMEKMATMLPAFDPAGTVTAATSSPLTAGAAALLVMERGKADKLGLEYHLKYVHGAIAGFDPTLMGMTPVPACKKLLERTGLKVKDIDLWEINEAFASQSLACLRELGIAQNAPFDNVNIWGGALALGHPLGQSGARLIVTLNNIMKNERKDATYGVASLCGAFGNGNASLFKNVNK
jgi:acetyl-CoA acyltransferase